MNRIFRGYGNRIDSPWKMYPVGFLFGLGFDTATEVALLVLAGTAVAGGLPVLGHPVAADPVRGGHEPVRHDRRVLHELRLRLGLRQAGAQGLLQPDHHRPVGRRGVRHRDHRAAWGSSPPQLGLHGPVFSFFAGVDINTAGFVIVGGFVATWVIAALYWHLGDVEAKWDSRMSSTEPVEVAEAA